MKIAQAFLIVNISEFPIPLELTIISILLLLPGSEELLALHTAEVCKCTMFSQNCKFLLQMLLLRFLWQQLKSAASHPSRESCEMDGNLWWTIAHFPRCRHNVCRAFPSTAELSLTAFHILQLQKNKKGCRIVAIKASARYLIYKCPYTILPISEVSRYFVTEQQHTSLRWQCATTEV